MSSWNKLQTDCHFWTPAALIPLKEHLVPLPRAADLFDRYHLTLFRYVCRSTGRRDVAEDVVQDVFVRVVRGLESYQSIGRDLAWLFAITRRVLLDRHRAVARRPEEMALDSEPRAATNQERSAVLADAIGRLPEPDREPFLLREVGGLTYEEIAVVCDLSLEAVRSRIYRARQQLRRSLASPGRLDRRPSIRKVPL
jgi:RNA polymerase sigma-70 factor (ECF subfamily)